MTSPEELATGTVLGGRYRIEAPLGRGGMGAVYRALDPRLGRSVALKVLSRRHRDAPDAVERFVREARAVARCAHRNLVQVFEVGDDPDCPWFVMEYLDGETLAQALRRRGPFPLAEARGIVRQVCGAMETIHRLGLIHRDVKPANIFLTREGRAVLMDFGLVKRPDERSLTLEGMILGTPEYMSPEQAQGHPLTPASDVYALGVVLFEMLAGTTPFAGGSPLSILRRHVEAPVPPLRAAHGPLPGGVSRALARALAKSPEQRFPSARDFAAALGEPPAPAALPPAPAPATAQRPGAPGDAGTARRIALRIAAVAGACAVLAGAWLALRPAPAPPPTPLGEAAVQQILTPLGLAELRPYLLKRTPLSEEERRELQHWYSAWDEGCPRGEAGLPALPRSADEAENEAVALLVATRLAREIRVPWLSRRRNHIARLRRGIDLYGAMWPARIRNFAKDAVRGEGVVR